MKGVLDILYKWCGALHRGADRREWDVYYNENVVIDFVGGNVTLTIREVTTRPIITTKTYTYTGDGIHAQQEIWEGDYKHICIIVEAVSCRSLVINGEVFI